MRGAIRGGREIREDVGRHRAFRAASLVGCAVLALVVGLLIGGGVVLWSRGDPSTARLLLIVALPCALTLFNLGLAVGEATGAIGALEGRDSTPVADDVDPSTCE